MSSTPYSPPAYLVTSTGLTAAQLRSQFDDFKRTLHFTTSAPELVFERVLANAFAVAALPPPPETDDELKETIEGLQNEISALNSNLNDIRTNVESSKAYHPDQALRTPTLSRVTPIKFTFVLGPHGLSTRAEPYDSYDGLYGNGCLWSDLKLVDNSVQFGTYNTISDYKSEPQPSQWGSQVTFRTRFREEPVVVVWLTGIDMRCDRPCHIQLDPEEVTESGFDVYITSSEDNVWYSLGYSWVAWPQGGSKYKYSSSYFDMGLYGRSAKPGIFNSKAHDLPKDSGVPVKTVLAVQKLAMGCGGTMPFFLRQEFPVKDALLFCELTTEADATGMYMLDIVCIVCASGA